LVVSEKNHAVDAIAAALLRRGGGEPGNSVWEETTAHGVVESLGNASKQFFIDAKAKNDPYVAAADREIIAADVAKKKSMKALREVIDGNKRCIIAAADSVGATWKDVKVKDKAKQHVSIAKACEAHEKDVETLADILGGVLPALRAGSAAGPAAEVRGSLAASRNTRVLVGWS
jgi:hypothetical protein